MEITVSGKHLDITDAIREYAEQKVSKLDTFYDQILNVEVIADKDHANEYEIEIIVHVGHHEPFIATKRGDDLYVTIDQARDKLERRLAEHKQKVKNHKHNPER
jgi:ribosome hibernation promoting factor